MYASGGVGFSTATWAIVPRPLIAVSSSCSLRTVALEFRSKEPGRRWRSAWDTVFAVASTGLAFLLGVAFGNIIDGLPLDAGANISSVLIGLLTPFTLLVGATTVAMFAMQGGIYLLIKTEVDTTLKNIKGEVDKLNKQNSELFKVVGKSAKQDLGKKAKEALDKKLTIYNKDGKKVQLNGDMKDGVPTVGVSGSF